MEDLKIGTRKVFSEMYWYVIDWYRLLENIFRYFFLKMSVI